MKKERIIEYHRLTDRVKESFKSSKTHLELSTMLKAISSHATNTACIFLIQTKKLKRDTNQSQN